MFAEAIEDILRDHCNAAAVRAIESGVSPAPLWASLADAGFLELLAPEAQNGAGLSLPELFPVLLHFGRYATPVPVAQAIAARALVASGVRLPAGILTLAPVLRRESDGRMCCPLVPYGGMAEHVLAAQGDQLLLLSCARAQRQPVGQHTQLSTLSWKDDQDAQPLAGTATALAPLGAAVQATLLAGAMNRVFEMTLQYCNERSQFGKSLGKFQAIQHQMSVMAEQVAAVTIAAEAALQVREPAAFQLTAAIAKSRASEAAPAVANAAHALHGAIGITEEFDLQLLTRRLHEWRIAHGSEAYWHGWVGQQVLAQPSKLLDFVRGD